MKKTALLLAMIILAVFVLASCSLFGGEEKACEHLDENSDHKCDECQEVLTEHQDSDDNNACDICGATICEHSDDDSDHLCDGCEKVLTSCHDSDNDHECDICGATLSEHADSGRDHKCDVCDAVISDHVDADGDNACDICLQRMCEHSDADSDHLCDACKKKITDCADNNSDHKCDTCGATLSDHKDEDDDNVCEICGGTICVHSDNTSDHLCDACGKPFTECQDSDNNHKCDICSAVLTSCLDKDGDYLCDICSVPFEDVFYSLNVSDIETGTRANDDINGKFTIVATTEVRTRTRVFNDVEYTKSIKIGSKTAGVKVNVPGDGKLSFLIQNGSSSANVQYVVLVDPDGNKQTIEFAGNNEGSPVVKLEIDVTEGEWTILRNSGTIDIYYLELSCKVPVSPECGFELVDTGNTDFISGTTLDFSGLRLNAVFESGKTEPLALENVTIDTSAVDMNKEGVYTVTVTYKEYSAITFEVSVYVPSELKFGFDAVEKIENSSAGNGVYYNHSFKELYFVGESFDATGLTVIVVAKCGNESLEFTVSDYNVSGFDSSEKGKKVLTVSYADISSEIVVHVTDQTPVIDSQSGVIKALVDPSYLSYVGELSGPFHIFNTIQQALDFLEAADDNVRKELYLSTGKYNEKIEITIPNLSIIGWGESVSDVVIEWDSLYGLEDASGFTHVTDSTATVSVRESAVGCIIDNVTISNYWNSIEVFDKDLGAGYAEHRALALLVQSDRFIMKNSALIGYQDTVEFFYGRQYLENCYIEGTTDFIFGTNNTTFFKNCQIHSIDNGKTDGGYITAFKGMNKNDEDSVVYGAIFFECKFTADEKVVKNSNTAIGRTWGKYAAVAVINCEIDGHVSTKASTGASKNERYVSMNGILPSDSTVQFVEFGNTGAGALAEAVNGMRMLTAEEAALYCNLGVVFGKINGKVSYLDAWDPFNNEVTVDDKTYYYFDQTVGTTGTSHTLDTATNLPVGESVQLGDMLIFAEGGKIAWNSNANALNMKAGALLRFTVPAGTEVLITAYPGYAAYTVNGVGAGAATFSRYFAEETEVTILSTGDCYLFSVIINPDEEAPVAPTLNELKVEGFNTNYTVGQSFSLDGVVLKAYYSDNSIHYITDYDCDYSAVNSDAEGVYDVVFNYGGKSLTVSVNYEDPNAGPEISENTVLDFTTQDGLLAVQNNKRVTIDGSVRHNGGEIQITGTISFQVKAGTVVTVIPYNDTQYASYTVTYDNETSEVLNSNIGFIVTTDTVVTYTGLSNNYLCQIIIECPVKDGKYVFGGSGEAGDVTGMLESGKNISISGTFKNHSGGAQMGEDSVISFVLPAFSKMVVKGYDTNYGLLNVSVDGESVEMDSNACYVFDNASPYGLTVLITAANAGTEEAPNYSRSYITYLDVEVSYVISEDQEVTFGSEGNYKDSGIDFSGANVRDNGGNNSQISSGSFSFVVKEGAVLVINGYPGYTSYTIFDGYILSETITEDKYEYVALSDCLITITAVDGNNYFYSFSVTYPSTEPEVPTDFEVTFGSEGNYKDSGIDFSGANVRDNGGNNSQISSGSFSFEVKAGGTLVINGYPGYTSYTIFDGTTTTEEITADTYTYTAEADVTVTITPVNSNNYFYSFKVTYPAGGGDVVEPEEPVVKEYVLDATADMAAFAQGDKADGDVEVAGTDGFFTVHYSAKTKVDGSTKEFEDGYSATQRINMGGKTTVGNSVLNAIEFTTQGTATVTVWWVCGGDGREIDLFGADGTILQTTAEGSTKNSLYISTFEISEAGKYYIGSSAGSNYYFKVEVEDTI